MLVVLVAAKLAAEGSERVGVPAVVGEILAGVLIGPSALGLVGGDEVLVVLGELGVILLLLQVGMEMDLAELGAVGRSSLTVAVIGVVVPFAAGGAVGVLAGMSGQEALFVGAALTATSVGITARVFSDLNALTTVEARTVLGAAVADDVIGLVILTVVVKLVSGDSVSALAIVGVVALAIGFLVVTTVVGVRIAPPVFAQVQQHSRSAGTLVGLALAFTLGVAELAEVAGLASIVGAFVAGISLSRCRAADRIRRDLAPVGHLFIPVFFLQIGIEADIGRFADPSVLALAGAMMVVAVIGKLLSAAGLFGRGDRLLVGIGMIPRGEVGLIFAAIGLRQHVFGEDVYAALLLVVLATTLLTPPALRWRLSRLRARVRASAVQSAPPGGWLLSGTGGPAANLTVGGRGADRAVGSDQTLTNHPPGDDRLVELAAEPPLGEALSVALEAALACESRRPGPRLLSWLGDLPDERLPWNPDAKRRLLELLAAGGPRSWRFLAVTGILNRALPELAEALRRRQADAGQIDPMAALRWPTLARLRENPNPPDLANPERLLLAAVVLDATDGGPDTPVVVARRLVKRLDLGATTEQAVAGLVGDTALLPAAARRLDALSEEPVLQLAAHLGSPERARAQYLLAQASVNGDAPLQDRLAALDKLLQQVLSHPELVGRGASNTVEERRARAGRLTDDPAVKERVAAAPRAYVLAANPVDLARQAALCEPPPGRRSVRVAVLDATTGDEAGRAPAADGATPDTSEYRVEFVAVDRVGLLAAEACVLAHLGLDVTGAIVATWADECALGSYVVSGPRADPDLLEVRLTETLNAPLSTPPAPDATFEVDNEASPWHSVATVEAADHRGLLHQLTAAFAAAGANVHAARLATVDGTARDVFELTDRSNDKLDDRTIERIRRALTEGASPSRWARLRVRYTKADRPQAATRE